MHAALRETIKLLDGCAILTLPADVDDDLLLSLTTEFYNHVTHEGLPGVVFDFSNLRAIDYQLAERLFEFANGVRTLGVQVEFCSICPGVASSLALLDFDAGDMPISPSLTDSLDAIRPQSGGHDAWIGCK